MDKWRYVSHYFQQNMKLSPSVLYLKIITFSNICIISFLLILKIKNYKKLQKIATFPVSFFSSSSS